MIIARKVPMENTRRSYSSLNNGLASRLKEAVLLAGWKNKNLPEKVRTLLARLNEAQADIESLSRRPTQHQHMLEIGPGQRFRQMNFFARNNDVLGIDLDELVQGFSPAGYVRMLRANGFTRVAKTLGRKVIGMDRAFDREMDRQIGSDAPKHFNVQRMDAGAMQFPAASFDVVYSYAVFEHIPDPERVMNEITRILKPGGVVHITLHLWTSDSGCHDPRVFSGRRDDVPLWAHLRPKHADDVKPNAYLNKLRLNDWNDIASRVWPDARTKLQQFSAYRLRPKIAELRSQNELADYTDDELLTTDYVVYWQKPLAV